MADQVLTQHLHLRVGQGRTRARAQPRDAQHQMSPSIVQKVFRNRQRRPHGDAIGANAAALRIQPRAHRCQRPSASHR